VTGTGRIREELCGETIVLLCEFEGRGEVLWVSFRVLSIACDSIVNLPGTKPILRAAITVVVLEKWRVWRRIGVRWGMRRIRSIKYSR
jgi:hypothetical protein